MDEELLADLNYISGYATMIRTEVINGNKPTIGYVNRMAELAEKVQRQLDSNYEEWCNAQARCGDGPQ